MNNSSYRNISEIVLFSIGELHYALYLFSVLQVIRPVEITPLPKTPKIVLGIINFHGEIIPAINIRKLFNLHVREINLEDRFIIAKTPFRTLALVVDSVEGISEVTDNEITDTKELLPFADYISGVTKIKNNIILINDLEKFLSLNEQIAIDKALKKLRDEANPVKE